MTAYQTPTPAATEPAHDPGPYSLRTITCAHGTHCIIDAAGTASEIAVCSGVHFEREQANAKRIVACLTACADIPTEALEAGAVARLIEISQLLVGWIDQQGPVWDFLDDIPSASLRQSLADALRALDREVPS